MSTVPLTRKDALLSALKWRVAGNPALQAFVVPLYMKLLFKAAARKRAGKLGLTCEFKGQVIDVCRGRELVRISIAHAIYLSDVIDHFRFFHGAVRPVQEDDWSVVDYSRTKLHDVIGFDLHPIVFPSIAEPVETTQQYLDFAGLEEGSVAIDLGAYSGLTSIMFRQQCGQTGRVIAVEADALNIVAIEQNVGRYEQVTNLRVELARGAVWTHNDGIAFSCEGGMGSSATSIVGDRLGAAATVPSFTLATLAERFGLSRVDFIKCDIEGAEAVIFNDDAFFGRFRPRMIIELHPVRGRSTGDQVLSALDRYGYQCQVVTQDGMSMPLLECRPSQSRL